MRAWTLGYPPAYEQAVRIPGNAKQPGGYAFRTREEALGHAATHADAARYEPYEIELPYDFDEVTLPVPAGDYFVLAVAAPFINPDTGDVA